MPIDQKVQFLALFLISLLFAGAFLLGLVHMRTAAVTESRFVHDAPMGRPARAAVFAAMFLGAGLLVWRAAANRSLALPVSNPFDAFLTLGLLLALGVGYFRWTRNLRSLSFFLLPMIAGLLVMGLILSLVHPAGNAGVYHDAWNRVHIVTIVVATVLFALACVGAAVYLLADRQLRRRGLDTSHRWVGLPPLASIEKFIRRTIYWGFPVLTIATVAGALEIAQGPAAGSLESGTGEGVKIVCGVLSWLVYGVVLQVPLNPRFRGRRAAWLAIAGFVFFLGAFAAAKWS